MAKLSSRNNTLQVVPTPQSPDMAGMMKPWGGTSANVPQGWLECDGSAVSRSTFDQLFGAIGTKYGVGDGTTTFNLPNGPRRTVELLLDVTYSQDDGNIIEYSTGFVYQTAQGEWRLQFNLNMQSGAVTAAPTATIAGIDWSSQGAAWAFNTLTPSGSQTSRALTGGSTGEIQAEYESAQAYFIVDGDLLLESKPTDAFVGADSRFSTFDEALESVPIIKLYNDESNVSMSDLLASPTQAGKIQLSGAYAAGDGVYGLVQANKVQRKNLAANAVSSGFIDENEDANFLFNVTASKWYRFSIVSRGLVQQNTTREIQVWLTNGTDRLAFMAEEIIGSNVGGQSQLISGSVVHQAVDTRFRVEIPVAGLGLDADISGDATTFIQIEELNNYIGTTDFT